VRACALKRLACALGRGRQNLLHDRGTHVQVVGRVRNPFPSQHVIFLFLLFFEGLSSTPLPQQAYTVALSIRNCATVAEVAMFIYAVRTDAPHSLCGIFGFIVSFIDFVFFFVFFYYTFAPAKKKKPIRRTRSV
jgi:hypothetical protein